jgi:hypothetical protein
MRCFPDGFLLFDKKGSIVQSACNAKAAAEAAFMMCEPDWANFEPIS